MLEHILVGAIVAVCAFFVVRTIVRTLRGKGDGGCDCCNKCGKK